MSILSVMSSHSRLTRFSVAWIVTSTIVLVGIVVFFGGGTMEREATLFVLQYTSDRPLLQKIFDPHANDLGTYQARELSYLADYADAVFYRFLYRTFGVAVFIPLSAVIATVVCGFIFFRAVARTTRIDLFTSTLIFGCFVSSFVFLSSMAVFYRSGKPLLAVVLLALLFHLRSIHQDRAGRAGPTSWLTRAGAAAGALALLAGLLDRQGVFYVGACCAILALHYWWTRQLRDVLVALVVTLAVLQVYNVVIGPMLVHSLNGYWPDFQYQSLSREHLWRLPIYALLAMQMLVENAALLVGGSVNAAVLLVAITSAALLLSGGLGRPFLRGSREMWYRLEFRPDLHTVAYLALAFGLQVVMFALMIARHPVVYVSLDHRYWYYTLPYAATVLFGGVILVEAVIAGASRASVMIIRAGLAVMLLANVATLRHHQRVMANGAWFAPVSAQSEAARRSLRSGSPDPLLQTEYARFVRHHRTMNVSR